MTSNASLKVLSISISCKCRVSCDMSRPCNNVCLMLKAFNMNINIIFFFFCDILDRPDCQLICQVFLLSFSHYYFECVYDNRKVNKDYLL